MTDEKIIDGGTSLQDLTDREITKEEEKTFTQSQLEEIISERLARERRANASLGEVKRILRSAKEGGLIQGGSYAQMAKQLVDALGVRSHEDVVNDDGRDVPEKNLPSDKDETADEDAVAVADAMADETEEETSGEESENTQPVLSDAENFIRVINELKGKFGEREIGMMLSGNLFSSFAKGRKESLDETVSAFRDFMACLCPKTKEDDSLGEEEGEEYSEEPFSDLASTAFSVYSGAVGNDTSLTKQQMEIAKSAGMSYREYASLLESVPMKKRK